LSPIAIAEQVQLPLRSGHQTRLAGHGELVPVGGADDADGLEPEGAVGEGHGGCEILGAGRGGEYSGPPTRDQRSIRMPPSMAYTWPVRKRASSLHRKRITGR